jgi:uncharacterized membrane protein
VLNVFGQIAMFWEIKKEVVSMWQRHGTDLARAVNVVWVMAAREYSCTRRNERRSLY